MYDRVLRPEWIDFALEKAVHANDKEELNLALREYLAAEVSSPTSLRKIVSQLQYAVGFQSSLPLDDRLAAYEQMRNLAPSERNKIRFQLIVRSTPFVADVVESIRKLTMLGVQGVHVQQLYERLIAKYGDRGTVPRRVRYVLTTLANLGVLENRGQKWYVVSDAIWN